MEGDRQSMLRTGDMGVSGEGCTSDGVTYEHHGTLREESDWRECNM